MKNKVVLAFSGGLDTSFCVKYLSVEKGMEVHSVFINTGGFTPEEEKAVEEKACALGVVHHESINVSDAYYRDCIRYMIYGNMLRNRTYPMSVSSERTFQAMAAVEYALKEGIGIIAHGSTGAGNDQVRFDMIFQIVAPGMEIMAPIRDLRLSREEEIEYLRKQGVEDTFRKYAYSINQGLWGTSVGGQETLTSDQGLPEEAWPDPVTGKDPVDISIAFEKGEIAGGLGGICRVKEQAKGFGIGRGIHVGETIIGIRGRVGFEAAAPMIILKAHHELEKYTLGKWQAYWKDQLSEWYGMMLHEGQYLDPVMRNIEVFLEESQANVTGEVLVRLRPYSFEVTGVRSKNDLMAASGSQYGEMNEGYTGEDVKGFTRIISNPDRIYHSIHKIK